MSRVDEENKRGADEQSPRAAGGFEDVDAREIEGGGMTARLRARIRLQRDQNIPGDRRGRPRPQLEHPDRRIAD